MEKITIEKFLERKGIPLSYRQAKNKTEEYEDKLVEEGVIFLHRTKKKKYTYIIDEAKYMKFLSSFLDF